MRNILVDQARRKNAQKRSGGDPRKAKIVMLHYFAGLTLPETEESLGISLSTVEREWRFARTLLYTQMADPKSEES